MLIRRFSRVVKRFSFLKEKSMHVTIEVPETLPQARVTQRVREIEESLREEAKFLETLNRITQETIDRDDPWGNSEVELPTVDTGIEDFSLNHDHYLYGTPKRS
jgi:hypothetical protein